MVFRRCSGRVRFLEIIKSGQCGVGEKRRHSAGFIAGAVSRFFPLRLREDQKSHRKTEGGRQLESKDMHEETEAHALVGIEKEAPTKSGAHLDNIVSPTLLREQPQPLVQPSSV